MTFKNVTINDKDKDKKSKGKKNERVLDNKIHEIEKKEEATVKTKSEENENTKVDRTDKYMPTY